MDLWHLVFRTDSLTYTICRALRECGHEVSVWVVDREYGIRQEDRIQKRLSATKGVRIVGRDQAKLPKTIDRLVMQSFPRPMEAVRDFPLLAARARAITLISAGDRSRRWRDAMSLQWLEARSLGPLAQRVDRVLYKDGFYRGDLFGLFRRRQVVGFDVHSQFLHGGEEFDVIHARNWRADARRTFLANFLGSQDPDSRKAVLDSVRHLFCKPSGEPQSPQPGKAMFWHEYSDAEPKAMPPTKFVDILTQSDFTLCPHGYSRVTHRPIEALLRGSIPVLDANELDLYGIELADGHNCVAVRSGNWPEAIERLTRLPDDAIARMRENVEAMREMTLEYRQLARAICARVGLETRPAPGRAAPISMPLHSR